VLRDARKCDVKRLFLPRMGLCRHILVKLANAKFNENPFCGFRALRADTRTESSGEANKQNFSMICCKRTKTQKGQLA
jgi:hypothetical protein